MLTLPQRINLGVGVVLAFLSTSATAYYLITVTGIHGLSAQVFAATAGIALEVARYSLSISRDKFLPFVLFLLSVGCSWSALNLGMAQLSQSQNAYLIAEYKADRVAAKEKAERYEMINYKEKADEQNAIATALLQKIQALETPQPQYQQRVNQLLIILVAILLDVVSVRCLLLGTPLSTDEGSGQSEDSSEQPQDTIEENSIEHQIPTPLVPSEPEDPMISEAKRLIQSGELSNSKNAIKKHFRIGWEKAVGVYNAINQEDKCEQS